MTNQPPRYPSNALVRRPPPKKSAFGGTLGMVALAVGVVALGGYMLDMHSHTCDVCGHRWRHLGAFNLGDQDAHTCRQCGAVQWWKCGFPQVFGVPGAPLPTATSVPTLAATTPQEIREVHQPGVPSSTLAGTPRGWPR